MTGHPGLGWATQPPALGGPYGNQGFWFFKSTAPYPKDRGMLFFFVEAARNGVNAITQKTRDGLF